MNIVSLIAALFSVLVPTKMWFAPNEKLLVKVDAQTQVHLVLSDFQGKLISTDVPTTFEPGATVDVRATFPAMRVGTYLLYAVPSDKFQPDQPRHNFIGTPLVIELRGDTRPGTTNSGPMVIHVEPLSVAKFHTSAGEMTAMFYYDAAPSTVENFIDLARQGFYDGRTFHRVVPGFVIQAGDPLADNSGGPGYQIDAEFNTRQHLEGVLSMAREGDPMEAQGAMPRPEFANTAGSQFFMCLNYERTKRLDRKYTAFGRLVAGLDVMHAIGNGELQDAASGRPVKPVTIDHLEIAPVTADNDPYLAAIERPVE